MLRVPGWNMLVTWWSMMCGRPSANRLRGLSTLAVLAEDLLEARAQDVDRLPGDDPVAGAQALHPEQEAALLRAECALLIVEDRLDRLEREEALVLQALDELQAVEVLLTVPRHVAAGLVSRGQEALLNVEVDRLPAVAGVLTSMICKPLLWSAT